MRSGSENTSRREAKRGRGGGACASWRWRWRAGRAGALAGISGWVGVLGVLGVVGVVGVMGGCASREERSTRPGDLVGEGRDPVSMLVGPQVGLNVQAVAVRAETAALAQVLQAYEGAPVPLDPSAVEAWGRCGLRVIAVPVGEAVELRERLISVGPALTPGGGGGTMPVIAGARQSLVQAGLRFGEVARGARWPARTLGLHDTRVQAPPGFVRLLGRCWMTKAPGDDAPSDALEVPAALRVQLVPQLVDARDGRGARRELGLEPQAQGLQDEGLTLWRLEATGVLARGTALVIVSGPIEGTWASWAERSGDTASGPGVPSGPGQVVRGGAPAEGADALRSGVDGAGVERAGPGTGEDAAEAGPFAGVVRTLGAELLEPGAEASGAPVRVVLFVMAQAPATMPRLPAARLVEDAKTPEPGAQP